MAQPIEPLTFLFFTSVASTFAAGSISAVSFARNFQSVPVALIGVAFAVTAFPVMSAAAADGDRARFTRLVATNLATITVLTLGAAIGLWLVGGFAVELFLGGEAFDAEDVELTTMLLGAFALSVPLEAMTHLLSRALYSTNNTILPVTASVVGLLVTVLTVNLLLDDHGVVALPLGFADGPRRPRSPCRRWPSCSACAPWARRPASKRHRPAPTGFGGRPSVPLRHRGPLHCRPWSRSPTRPTSTRSSRSSTMPRRAGRPAATCTPCGSTPAWP